MCHCPACFLKVFQGVGGQWQWYSRVQPCSKQGALMPCTFWPPLPCSRQVGRHHNTLALALGIPTRKIGASTEIGHLGAERPGGYPVAPCKDIRHV